MRRGVKGVIVVVSFQAGSFEPLNKSRSLFLSSSSSTHSTTEMYCKAVFAILAVVFLHTVSADKCYYPDGTIATDYTYQPCVGSGISSCCIPSEGDKCLSNGLCIDGIRNYPFRGACTGVSRESGPRCQLLT